MNKSKARKGIVLAGGSGTRLHPLTTSISKQMLPVYDKPMIYYPITTLMLAGIRDILLITTPADLQLFTRLLGDGSQWGLKIEYATQARPEGIAQALLIAAEFLDGAPSALILGDNIFHGDGLGQALQRVSADGSGAYIFAYYVKDPERYGVVEFNSENEPIRLVEKPTSYVSNWAVTGLYFFDHRAVEVAQNLSPSERGELEITDVNAAYLSAGDLKVERLGRGYAWLDAGTHDSLLESAQFVQIVERRQGLKIACPEEIAFHQGFIDSHQLMHLARALPKTGYGEYLMQRAALTIGRE